MAKKFIFKITLLYRYTVWFAHSRMFIPDIAHHDVDEGVLYEAEEHEEGTRRHEHVDCLNKNNILEEVRNIWQMESQWDIYREREKKR